MSGEFGGYTSGYFWSQIEQDADDCREGGEELTRLWGLFLAEFAPVARAISWVEAGDSSPGHAIKVTREHLSALERLLAEISGYVEAANEQESGGES